jgi:hypothetical protein
MPPQRRPRRQKVIFPMSEIIRRRESRKQVESRINPTTSGTDAKDREGERIRAQLRAHAARRDRVKCAADIFIKVAAGEMQQNKAALLLEFVAESDREEILQIVVNRVTQDSGGIVAPIVRKTAARLFHWLRLEDIPPEGSARARCSTAT